MWQTEHPRHTINCVVPPHLLVDISAHGFGHLAQTAPVLNALHTRLPNLELTIRSALPLARLTQRIHAPFVHIPQASDFGLSMKSALEVDVSASLARYRALHADWDAHVQTYAQEIANLGPDLVLSNISYLAVAAARQARIPALAMCSLNWLDIVRPYAPASAALDDMFAQILQSYNSASHFLRLTPGMPMPQIQNKIVIGPIASSSARPNCLRARLGLAPATRLILVAMGGIPLRLPETWPSLPGYRWIVPGSVALPREDMLALESLDLPFIDILAGADAVLTKSGYGAFVEASVCGTPVLYVERPGWPEEPCLVAWLHQHNSAQVISRMQFEQGAFGSALDALLQGPRPQASASSGIDEAADFIQAQLRHAG